MKKSIIKYFTLFLSIIAVILGIVVVCNVIPATAVINYLIVIALGLFGIAKICVYASAPKPSAWDLVLGILFLIVSVFLLSHDPITMSATIGYVLAFLAIVGSIAHFMIAYEIHKHAKNASISGEVVSGIIYILLGICFIVLPIYTQLAYVYIVGIFLIVAGIVGAINALTISTRLKK